MRALLEGEGMLDEAEEMGKPRNAGPTASTGPVGPANAGPANAGMY